jgi:hypothetical protein
MMAIGLDLAVRAAPPTTVVAIVLAKVQEQLDSRGATSRQLFTVAFDPPGEKIEVTLRANPLSAGYPELSIVFGAIARTCAEDMIAPHQLRRIAFAEDLVSLELVNGRGEPEVYLFPIRAGSP